jgi:transposase-like protein
MATPHPDTIRRVLGDSPSVTAAAERLGVSRNTLYRWMRQNGITVGRRIVPTHPNDAA